MVHPEKKNMPAIFNASTSMPEKNIVKSIKPIYQGLWFGIARLSFLQGILCYYLSLKEGGGGQSPWPSLNLAVIWRPIFVKP